MNIPLKDSEWEPSVNVSAESGGEKKMYLIALCDNEKAELDKSEKMLEDYEKKHPGLNFMIRRFENADKLLNRIIKENYTPDLIFMDIFMPDKTGLEAARELRDMKYKGKLVFLTVSKEYALAAFDVYAAQYLVKPVSEDKLFSVLDRFLEDTEEERKRYILLRIERRLVKISLDDIVYCEAQGKNTMPVPCKWHAVPSAYDHDGDTMSWLSPYREFIRIGVGFIVNLGCISSLNAKRALYG